MGHCLPAIPSDSPAATRSAGFEIAEAPEVPTAENVATGFPCLGVRCGRSPFRAGLCWPLGIRVTSGVGCVCSALADSDSHLEPQYTVPGIQVETSVRAS